MHQIEITPAELRLLIAQAEQGGLSADVVTKLEWFLYYLENSESVSATCEKFGIARSTFYRWLNRFDTSDLSTLEERSHRPQILRKPKINQVIVNLVRTYRMENPYLGKQHIVERLAVEHGLTVSASSVARIIEEHCLYFGTTPLHKKKRLTNRLVEEESDVYNSPVEGQASEVAAFTQAFINLLAYFWRTFRVTIVVASLLINIVFLTVLYMNAQHEKELALQRAAAPDVPPVSVPRE